MEIIIDQIIILTFTSYNFIWKNLQKISLFREKSICV